MQINYQFSRNLTKGFISFTILLLLFLTSLYSYLLFHTLAELFSIVIACSIFVLAWNFRRFYKDSFLIFISTAFLFCSFIDLLHALSYKGMGILQGYDANLPTQLWIAARYMQCISLLAAPLFLKRKINISWLMGGFTLATILILLSIFIWNVFPTSYIESVGLTPFKIISEYVIDLLLFTTILILIHNRQLLDRKVLQWMVLSIGITMISELAFTFYVDVYGLSNLIGHFCRIIAVFLFYKAIIETETGAIFTDMKQLRVTESALRTSEFQMQRSLAELSGIYANTPVGLCFFDPSLRYQAINDMLADINGLPAADHIGKSLSEILPSELAQPIEQSLRRTLETGQPVLNQELSGTMNLTSHRRRHWLVSYHPVVGSGGILLGVSCVVQDVTEQNQAKEALHASRQNLKLFIEYAPASIAMFDNDMRYIAASQRYLTDYRIKDQAIVGRSHYEIFPEIPESWKEIHRRCLAGAIEKAEEDPFPRADGSIDWVRWEIHPWHDNQGAIGGIILFSEVISERKQSEQKLRESEARFRTLIDEAPIAIALSRESKFLYVNAAYLKMHGIGSTDELIGHPIYERVAPESLSLSKERTYRRVHGLPVEKNYEYVALRQDGTHTPTIAAVSRVNLVDGPATVGFFQDITERKLAEDRIRQQNAILAGINRIFQEAMTCETEEELGQVCLAVVQEITQSRFGILGEINRKTGLLDDIAISDPSCEDAQRKQDSSRFGKKLAIGSQIQEIGGRVVHEGKGFFTNDLPGHPDGVVTPSGHSPLIAFLGVPLIHSEGIIGMIGLGNREGGYRQEDLDVTQSLVLAIVQVMKYKRAEQELAQAHHALQDYAGNLTHSNQELEQFAFIASHDLQEPLRRIRMFGKRLQQQMYEEFPGEQASEAFDSLRRMQIAAERMEKMIDGLLELSRVNTRSGNFEPTQLNEIVEEAINDLEARIKATGGQVIVGELFSAEVDPMQIRRLFQNLIGNALKFHKADIPPLIEINGTIIHSPASSSITISVKDNGIGFDEQYAQRIFQPFQRLHGRSEYEGTGLGLSICQRIVERHHGKIEAHSRPGEGAQFLVMLPTNQSNISSQ